MGSHSHDRIAALGLDGLLLALLVVFLLLLLFVGLPGLPGGGR